MGTMQRQFCLDMLKVTWVGSDGFKKSDCAIILEIEAVGGLIQTTIAIPHDSEITLETEVGVVKGHVTNCEQDAYGFIVNFAVTEQASNWFPEYVPPFLQSASGR